MTARELLADLRRRGVGVFFDPEDRRVHLAGEAVTGIDREELTHTIIPLRSAMRPILEAELAAGWSPWWPPAPDAPCPRCGGVRFALSAALAAWRCGGCEPLTSVPVAWAETDAKGGTGVARSAWTPQNASLNDGGASV